MVIFDEKRYASACLEPPVPKCYLAQLDAQNDVLVLENLEHSGYRKYAGGKFFTDVDHCKVVLRRIAHFHAFSTLIQVSESAFFTIYMRRRMTLIIFYHMNFVIHMVKEVVDFGVGSYFCFSFTLVPAALE